MNSDKRRSDMKVLWILMLVQIANTTNALDKVPSRKCCNNETNLLHNNKCTVDSKGKSSPIALSCTSRYVLNPFSFEDDKYNVTVNGSLFILDLQSAIMPSDFCLVNQRDDDERDDEYEDGDIHEIAIVCFPELEFSDDLMKLTFGVKAFLIFTSVAFLLLTLYIYFRLTELRETQDKVTIMCLINLTTFLFYLGIIQIQTPVYSSNNICITLAFIVYFFTMGYFAWLNCVILNVWKTVVMRRWKIREHYWLLLNHVYGWSVPIIMTGVVAVKHTIKPSIGVTTCWFHNDDDQWTLVYLPISIMLALNVFLCLWTSFCLLNSDISPDARKALRYKTILYLKLFLLGGFTWIFEVLSYTFNDHAATAWLWVIVDFFNCLHGVLIFFVLILWRQRIRKELAGKKILFYTCPTKWADVDDDEEICLDREGKGKYDLIIKTLK